MTNESPLFARAVVVMGKLPRPGRVKTRLQLPGEVAARLYRAFLFDVFARVQTALSLRPGHGVFACALEPGDTLAEAEALTPDGWTLVVQSGADLGERMRHAWRSGQAKAALVMGSDLPTLPAARIVEAFDALEAHGEGRRAVFIPADDGGYVLFGLARDEPALFQGIAWSTATVMETTAAAAEQAGIELIRLASHADVDGPEDLRRVAREAPPDTHTARAIVALGLRF